MNRIYVPAGSADLASTNKVVVTADCEKVFNYAAQSLGKPALKKLTVTNHCDRELSGIAVKVTPSDGFAQPITRFVERLAAGQKVDITDVTLTPGVKYLDKLTEKTPAALVLEAFQGEELLYTDSVPLELQPLNEWPGNSVGAHSVACFVTPNHPVIREMQPALGEKLKAHDYSPNRPAYYWGQAFVTKVLEGIFGVVKDLKLQYNTMPPSFARTGQRVRLYHQIMESRCCNCVDVSCLFAGFMEAVGLHPVMMGVTGHMFAGCWTKPDLAHADVVCTDVGTVLQHIAAGNLIVVECTSSKEGDATTYAQACANSAESLKKQGYFNYMVDVKQARRKGILPIPVPSRQEDGTWRIVTEERRPEPASGLTSEEEEKFSAPKLTLEDEKWAGWEQEVMNAGAGNSLLNMRPRQVIPLLAPPLARLTAAAGQECCLLAAPEEWTARSWDFAALEVGKELRGQLDRELEIRRLRSALSDGQLDKAVRELTRAAEKAEQESGVHTLHLAAGVLRWQEKDRSGKAVDRFSPLVVYPIGFFRRNNAVHLRTVGEGEVNDALVQKLRRTFGVDLRALLQTEEGEGVAVDKVLAYTARAIVGQPGWQVLDAAVIGAFAFNTYAQWVELHENRAEIASHPVSGSLLKGQLQWEACRVEEGGDYRPTVTRAMDPSQLQVVRAAAEGRTVVMVGPPGTGKSETICSAVEDSIAAGKRVLFVTGKAEARDAVLSRLEQKGLGSCCLALKPGSTGRQEAARQLRRAAERETPRSRAVDSYEAQLRKVERLEKSVGGFYEGLFRPGSSGKSLQELAESYEECRRAKGINKARLGGGLLTPERLEEQEELLRSMTYTARELKVSRHPLRTLNPADADRVTLNTQLTDYLTRLESLSDSAADVAALFDLPTPETYEQLVRLETLAHTVKPWMELPHNFGGDDPETYFASIEQLAEDYRRIGGQRRRLQRHFRPEFTGCEGEELLASYEKDGRRLSRSLLNQVQKYTALALTRDSAADYLDQLSRLKEAEREAGRRFARRGADLGLDDPAAADWSRVERTVRDCRRSWNRLAGEFPPQVLAAAIRHCEEADRFLYDFESVTLRRPACLAFRHQGDNWVKEQKEQCRRLLKHLPRLDEWSVWSDLRRRADELGMGVVADILEAGFDGEETCRGYRKATHQLLMEQTMAEEPALAGYRRLLFAQQVEELRREKEKLWRLAAAEISRRVAEGSDLTLEGGRSTEANLLQRWLKGPRMLTVRQLFEKAPNIISKLCPCIMADPRTLAACVPYRRGEFDVVIFDEASQLTAAESVAAISRAKDPAQGGSVIICGDPQQMPPTRYFASGGPEDTDRLELVDLESVLNECLALNMPKLQLMYHYRSRHEDLIAFSNHAFYDGRLITMPGVNDGASHVKLIRVDGVYGRGGSRCNRAEAEAIVAELKRRCRDEAVSGQSVGIITMNVQQQALVEQLLAEACDSDPQLTAWLQQAEEKLFVQNLESVQGSERDVILLSLNYGPDEKGQVSLAFGPLTREGGYRRFNVAISRAREEMQVYTSIAAEDISPRKTSGRGMLALRDFLRYARTGALPTGQNDAPARRPSPIGEAICRALTAEGYEVKQDLGSSAFRVNAAVVDADDPGHYRLGILLDEDCGLDRDELAVQLRRSGWDIVRVRTPDWLSSPELVIEDILDRLREEEAVAC